MTDRVQPNGNGKKYRSNKIKGQNISRTTVDQGGNLQPLGKGSGGRPKGSPNRLTAVVKDVIASAADRIGGIDRLVEWIEEDPINERVFCSQIYVRLLPLQINARTEITKRVEYKSYSEVRLALIEKGVPEDKVDALLQANVKVPRLATSDVRS